jgi:predicted RNA-binding protein (virulence factor B family)
MIEIGKYNRLEVKTSSPIGLYLTDGRDDVLLPKKYVPESTEVGDEMEVFVYLDNENRPIATTLEPNAYVDDFAFLKVKDVNEFGAFLDWGIAKDIFVSYAEQRVEMSVGEYYIVYIFLDDVSGRIAATSKWNKYIDTDTSVLQVGDEVELMIAEKTDLGYKAIVDNQFEGLIYANEVFGELKTGDMKRGYVKLIRDDGKIDLRLTPQGYTHIEESQNVLLRQLEANDGTLPLGDKSQPEEIYERLKMSKKAFKKAAGGLFKDRKITISDFEIKLVNQNLK